MKESWKNKWHNKKLSNWFESVPMEYLPLMYKHLTHAEWAIFMYLVNISRNGALPSATFQSISKGTGVELRSTRTIVYSMVKKGKLKKEKNTYDLSPLFSFFEESLKESRKKADREKEHKVLSLAPPVSALNNIHIIFKNIIPNNKPEETLHSFRKYALGEKGSFFTEDEQQDLLKAYDLVKWKFNNNNMNWQEKFYELGKSYFSFLKNRTGYDFENLDSQLIKSIKSNIKDYSRLFSDRKYVQN